MSRLKALSTVATTCTERQVSAWYGLEDLSCPLASAFFFFLRRLATPALRLGVLAASWLLSEAFVFLRWSTMYDVWVRLVLHFFAVFRYGYTYSSTSATASS